MTTLERLLRPPYEFISAATAATMGSLLVTQPTWFLLSQSAALAVSSALLSVGAWRAYQGSQVVRYHRHLRQLPLYQLSSQEVPLSHQKLFLGKGFSWQAKHTQRYYDLMQTSAARYREPSKAYRWARTKEIQWEKRQSTLLKQWAALLSRPVWWNPVKPLPLVGGDPAIHGIELHEQNVWMSLSERVGHTLVLGTTRVGKTRFLELLLAQDIRRGDTVIVIDPKGDQALLNRIKKEAAQTGRTDDVLIFNLGFPDSSARYNAIGSFSRITEVATRIAGQLPQDGNARAFAEFAWLFTNIIARALVALGRKPDYTQISRYIANIETLLLEYARVWLPTVDPHWQEAVKLIERELDESNKPLSMKGKPNYSVAIVQYIKQRRYGDPVADGLCSAFEYDKTYFDKITVSLRPFLEKLTTGKTAELIAPDYFDIDDERPIFDWMQIIRGKKIVYVGLDALSDTLVSAAVGNAMFSDLVSVAGQLYKHGTEFGLPKLSTKLAPLPSICVHADEFNELIGDEFVPLLNKSGGAGIQVTAYTQTWSDVEARIGSKAKAGQIAGNFNTLVMLRVKELATANMLLDQLPLVRVATLTGGSSVSDSPLLGQVDFSTSNDDRIVTSEVPMLTANQIMSLPKGQAFALIEGNKLWKLRLPLPKDDE